MNTGKRFAQRDVFWNSVYEHARANSDIVIVAADLAAPSLDRFRKDLPHQFVNTGIAEQNAILVGGGLARTGRRVFVYGITPFITFNCLEKIRVESGFCGTPMTIVGLGSGFSYPESGPTHHATEDLAVMRTIPGLDVFTITDASMCAALAERICREGGFNYLRLDRDVLPDVHSPETSFNEGFIELRQGRDGCILATGNLVHEALRLAEELQPDCSLAVIDVFRYPLDVPGLLSAISPHRKIATIEEHSLIGGLGSALAEALVDQGAIKSVLRLGVDPKLGFCPTYGDRQRLREFFGLDFPTLHRKLAAHFSSKERL